MFVQCFSPCWIIYNLNHDITKYEKICHKYKKTLDEPISSLCKGF
jgi:hypothetical protein